MVDSRCSDEVVRGKTTLTSGAWNHPCQASQQHSSSEVVSKQKRLILILANPNCFVLQLPKAGSPQQNLEQCCLTFFRRLGKVTYSLAIISWWSLTTTL